jgi:large subunit ribosomal protein L31e
LRVALPKKKIVKKVARDTVITRDYSVNLHKRLQGIKFKKRAPRAVRVLKHFAKTAMRTEDVRIDTKLNKFLWSQGIRHVPYRVRIRLQRKRNDDEDAKNKMYTLVSHVPVTTYKGLVTQKIE